MGVKHFDVTGYCADTFFENCASNVYQGRHDTEGPTEVTHSGNDKPNWRRCIVCYSACCTYCTPDRIIDKNAQATAKGFFECPGCVNSSKELSFVLGYKRASYALAGRCSLNHWNPC